MTAQASDSLRLFSKSEYARRRGVTPAQVTHWSKAGRIKIVDGKVDAKASDAMLRGSLNPLQGGKPDRGRRSEEVPEAQTVNEAVLAEKVASTALKQLKLEREAGRLVDRFEFELTTEAIFAQLRDAMMAIANRLGALVAAEDDARKCTELIATEVRKALNVAAEAQEALAIVGATRQ